METSLDKRLKISYLLFIIDYYSKHHLLALTAVAVVKKT